MAALSVAAAVACGVQDAPEPSAGATADPQGYVVERSEGDGAAFVRTVSGSKWGGEGRLVAELSIGEETGAEPYLFGAVIAAWEAGDRIYVVDAQVPAVRAFDLEGTHLFDLGRAGQGPGEYSRPMALAVGDDGRVMVTDLMGARLNIYGEGGDAVEDWSLGSPQASVGLVLSYDQQVFTRVVELPEDLSSFDPTNLRMGVRQVGPEGFVGDPLFPPPIDYDPPTVSIEVMGREIEMPIVPFAPTFEWAFAPGGEMIVGVGDLYRFEIHRPDGTITVVEKAWEPVAVQDEEAAFRADEAAASMRQMAPDWRLDVDEVPATKPAFMTFFPDRSGRLWVGREGPGELDVLCTMRNSGAGLTLMVGASGGTDVRLAGGDGGGGDRDGPCWASRFSFDLFELASGEFLGTVQAPERGFSAPLFVDGDSVLAVVADELGTVRLKKYRLETS